MARLSTRAEVCPAFTGPHERTPAVIMPRNTREAMAASATGISAIARSFPAGLSPTGPGTVTAGRRPGLAAAGAHLLGCGVLHEIFGFTPM